MEQKIKDEIMQGLKRLGHDIVNSSITEMNDGTIRVLVDSYEEDGVDDSVNFDLEFVGRDASELADDAIRQYYEYNAEDEAEKTIREMAKYYDYIFDRDDERAYSLLVKGKESVKDQILDIRDLFRDIYNGNYKEDEEDIDIYEDLESDIDDIDKYVD